MKEQPNKRSTPKKTGTRIYERAERSGREPLGTTTQWLMNNANFCYGGESPANNDNEKNNTFCNIKEKHKNTKEAHTDGSKSMGSKIGFAPFFIDITRRGVQPEETSIYTAEMMAIKVELKKIYKREDKKWVIYTNSQSYIHTKNCLRKILVFSRNNPIFIANKTNFVNDRHVNG